MVSLHKDIVASKESVCIIFDNGLSYECTGEMANKVLFEGFEPFNDVQGAIEQKEKEQAEIESQAQLEGFEEIDEAPF